MSVGEVMEKGQAAGLNFSFDLVRKVRQCMAQSGGKRRKPGRPRKNEERPAVAAKPGRKPKAAAAQGRGADEAKGKARRGAARPTDSKAAFIESFPHETPASEVVAEGKAAGVKFSPSYVYYVRGAGQRRGKPSAPSAQASSPAPSAPRQAAAPSSSRGAGSVDQDEAEFFDLVLRVGLTRAQQLLGQVRERLSSLVGMR